MTTGPAGRKRAARLLALSILLGCGLNAATPAYAECGGLQECIAVSTNPAVAPAHSLDGVNRPAPTLQFGNQAITTTSATRPILVAGVEGPPGTRATLLSITLTGPNAADFTLAGGTCTVGAPSLLHDGALVAQIANACTILVTFNPAAVGVKTAQVNVRSASISRVAPLSGTATATPPAAAAATMTVRFDTPTTLDLSPFISGASLLGVRVVAQPAHGAVTVSGTSVTYTPARGYIGPDAFSYETFSATAASPPAVVSVTVQARPDPSKDANVVGVIEAQAQTAARFLRAQRFNFQRRMESLRSGSSGAATTAAADPAPRAPAPGASGLTGLAREAQPRPGALPAPPRGDDIAFGALPGSTEPSRAMDGPAALRPAQSAGGGAGGLLASLGGSLVGAASTRSLDLSYSSNGAGKGSTLPGGLGAWIGGNVQFGTRDPTSASSGLQFNTDGVSAGVDRRFGERLTLGLGIGYGRDRTDVGSDGTKSASSGASVAAYGSYRPTLNTFIDGLIGYGRIDQDTDRYVAASNAYVHGERSGSQVFGSIAAGYEHRSGTLLVVPYGRLDFGASRLDQYSERGAAADALTYFEHDPSSLQAALGLRLESRHDTSFGWALPRLRVEASHEFKGARAATISYADQIAGPRYLVLPADNKRNSVLLGIGSDFVTRRGLTLGIDYQAEHLVGSDTNHLVRLQLSQELDGKGWRPLLPASSTFANPLRVEGGYTWDDNVTRGRDSSEKLSDQIYSLNVVKTFVIPVTSHTRAVLSGFLNGDKFGTYSGLDRLSGGGHAEFQYRTSAEYTAPTFGVFGRASYDEYDSEMRTGYRYSLGVNARQSLTDRIDLFGALSASSRHAESEVFDGRDWSARFNLDFTPGRAGTLYLGGEYRQGDTVSTGRQSVDSIVYAEALAPDDAFANSRLIAYRLEARTVIWTLGYNIPLGPRDSIDFSWRHARSTGTDSPDLSRAGPYGLAGASPMAGAPRYTVDQFSIVYLTRF